MEITRYQPGTPSWIDLGTPDLEAAISFYSGLFGWDVILGDPSMGRYSMAQLRGLNVAGMADQQQPGPPFWASYITVDSIEDTVARVDKAGGTVVMPPMEITDAGTMAVAQDTGGAFISFWQPNQHIGAQLVNEHGTLVWNELTTRAVDESIAFYSEVVGCFLMRSQSDDMEYYEWHRGDGQVSVGGMMPMTGDMWPAELPNHWMVYFAVDDADATASRCTELGGTVSVPPQDIPPGRFSVLNDPQGAVFSVITMAPGQLQPSQT